MGIINIYDRMTAEQRGVKSEKFSCGIFSKCTHLFPCLGKCCMDRNREDYICHLLTQFDVFFLLLGINPNADGKGRCFNIILNVYSSSVACVIIALLLITIAEFSLSCSCPALCIYHALSTISYSSTLLFYLSWVFVVKKRNLCISSLARALRGCALCKQLGYMVFILKTLLVLIYLVLSIFLTKDMAIFLYSYIVDGSVIIPDMIPVPPSFPPSVSVIRYIFVTLNRTFYFSSLSLFQINLGLWCYLLYKAFKYCNSNIECAMARGKMVSPETIENNRYKYEQCLTALSNVDQLISLYIGLIVFSCLAVACVMIYFAAGDTSNFPLVNLGLMSTIVLLMTTIVPPLLVENKVSALSLFKVRYNI